MPITIFSWYDSYVLSLTWVAWPLATSQLDGWHVLSVGLPLHLVQKLQLGQNSAARMLRGALRYFIHAERTALAASLLAHQIQELAADMLFNLLSIKFMLCCSSPHGKHIPGETQPIIHFYYYPR